MNEKTVFISYRRDATGKLFARSLKEALTHHNYEVFLDVDSLGSGNWAEQILTQVPKRNHFLLLLTPDALNRCVRQDDWVRREYLAAVETGRNIVPVLEESVDLYQLKNTCPDCMQSIFEHQIATIQHAHFSRDVAILVERYIPPRNSPSHQSRVNPLPLVSTPVIYTASDQPPPPRTQNAPQLTRARRASFPPHAPQPPPPADLPAIKFSWSRLFLNFVLWSMGISALLGLAAVIYFYDVGDQLSLRKLSNQISPPKLPQHLTTRPTTMLEKEFTNSLGLKMVRIPAGNFVMGSPKAENGRNKNDEMLHAIRLTNDYYLGQTEVTIGMFKRFIEENPSYKTETEKGNAGYHHNAENQWQKNPDLSWRQPGFIQSTDDHPVVLVSWNDALAFCDWMKRKEGKHYRLPTEAEWEYACRAHSETCYPHGNDAMRLTTFGNVADLSYNEASPLVVQMQDGYQFTAPVGKYKKNDFDLFDMIGNVSEWCSDVYEADYYNHSPLENPLGPPALPNSLRVVRGGAYLSLATDCRSASRNYQQPQYSNISLGFRIALDASAD